MTNHQVLNPGDHGAMRIVTQAGAEYGDGVSASLAVPPEFRRLACEYPILFRYDADRQGFGALALFGFEPGENLFIVDGQWDASCRPLAMAIQPFLVGRSRDGDAATQVHVDMGHPRVSSTGEGMRVFDDSGQPTPYLEEIAAMLGALDQGFRASGDFFAALERYELLEPFSMDIPTADGGTQRMVGYHLINEEKVHQLKPGALAELNAAGHLGPIFMAMASLGNLGKLARRKQRRGHG